MSGRSKPKLRRPNEGSVGAKQEAKTKSDSDVSGKEKAVVDEVHSSESSLENRSKSRVVDELVKSDAASPSGAASVSFTLKRPGARLEAASCAFKPDEEEEDGVEGKGKKDDAKGQPRRSLRRSAGDKSGDAAAPVEGDAGKTDNKSKNESKAKSELSDKDEEVTTHDDANETSLSPMRPPVVLQGGSTTVKVKRYKDDTVLDWPVEFIQHTKTEPVLIFSVNPMYFDFGNSHDGEGKKEAVHFEFLPRQVLHPKKKSTSPKAIDDSVEKTHDDGETTVSKRKKKKKKKHKKKKSKKSKEVEDADNPMASSTSPTKRKHSSSANPGEEDSVAEGEPTSKKHKKSKKTKKRKRSKSHKSVDNPESTTGDNNEDTTKKKHRKHKSKKSKHNKKETPAPEVRSEDNNSDNPTDDDNNPGKEKDIEKVSKTEGNGPLVTKVSETTNKCDTNSKDKRVKEETIQPVAVIKSESTEVKKLDSKPKPPGSGLVAYSSDDDEEDKGDSAVKVEKSSPLGKDAKSKTGAKENVGKKEHSNSLKKCEASLKKSEVKSDPGKKAASTGHNAKSEKEKGSKTPGGIKGTEKSTWDSSDSELEEGAAQGTVAQVAEGEKVALVKKSSGSEHSDRSRRQSRRKSYSSSRSRSRHDSRSSRSYSRSRSRSHRRRRRRSYDSYSRSRSRSYSSSRSSSYSSYSSRSSYSYSRSRSRSSYYSRSRSSRSRSRSASYRRPYSSKMSPDPRYSSLPRREIRQGPNRGMTTGGGIQKTSPSGGEGDKALETLRKLQKKANGGEDVPPNVKADLNKTNSAANSESGQVVYGPHLPGENPGSDKERKSGDTASEGTSVAGAGLDIPLPKDKPKVTSKPQPGQWHPAMDFGGPVSKKKGKKGKAGTQNIPLPTSGGAPITSGGTYIGPQVPPAMAKTLGLDMSGAENAHKRKGTEAEAHSAAKRQAADSGSNFVIPPEKVEQYKALAEQAKKHALKQTGGGGTEAEEATGQVMDAATLQALTASGELSGSIPMSMMAAYAGGEGLAGYPGTSFTNTSAAAAMLQALALSSNAGAAQCQSVAALTPQMVQWPQMQQQNLSAHLLAKASALKSSFPGASVGMANASIIQQLQMQMQLQALQQQGGLMAAQGASGQQPMFASAPGGGLVQLVHPLMQAQAAMAGQHPQLISAAQYRRKGPGCAPGSRTLSKMSHAVGMLPDPVSKSSITQSYCDQIEVIIDGKKLTVTVMDLEEIRTLGRSRCATVKSMRHKTAKCIFAVKIMRWSNNSEQQQQCIKRDLNLSMLSSKCPYIITSYGTLFHEDDIWTCMELLDISMDNFYMMVGAQHKVLPEDLLAYISYCVVSALKYLHSELHVMHRNVRPSRILADKLGRVKVFVGYVEQLEIEFEHTSDLNYLAPEWIDGKGAMTGYDIKSDVWSLGITLLELAMGRFPYQGWATPLFLGLQQLIDGIDKPSPTLPYDTPYTTTVQRFIDRCLNKTAELRPNYIELLEDPFLTNLDFGEELPKKMATFVVEILSAAETGASCE